MHAFEWVDATSVEHAVTLLAKSGSGAVAKAGGMDLLDLMKEGIVAPSRVVNLATIGGLDGIRMRPSGELEIGAMTTLASIEASGEIRERYAALSEAAAHAATPQVRNAATIGGNLLQKPRCWYYRNAILHTTHFGGDDPARAGENQFHAIFDNQETSMVHASTPATALVAFGASVELAGPDGSRRTVAVAEFLRPATWRDDRVSNIEPGEVLTHVVLPPMGGARSAYHKQTERDSYDWPICDVAAVLRMDGGTVQSAAIVMGWVAPVPRRATKSEALLAGKAVDAQTAALAAKAAVAEATPLSKNGYKVPILKAVVRRVILAAAGA